MGMPAIPNAVTSIEELLALPEDGMRHELLDGVHVVTPSPTYGHQSLLSTLFTHLLRATENHNFCQVLTSPAEIVLGPRTLVQPDLFVIRIDPSHPPKDWRDVGVPVIAIEILSPSTASRDRVAKRHIYQEVGIREYWIVDAKSRVIERWRTSDDRPEVCDETLAWSIEDGPSAELSMVELFGDQPTG